MFWQKMWGQLLGCPLLASGLLGDKHMHNIRVLVRTKDLHGLSLPVRVAGTRICWTGAG